MGQGWLWRWLEWRRVDVNVAGVVVVQRVGRLMMLISDAEAAASVHPRCTLQPELVPQWSQHSRASFVQKQHYITKWDLSNVTYSYANRSDKCKKEHNINRKNTAQANTITHKDRFTKKKEQNCFQLVTYLRDLCRRKRPLNQGSFVLLLFVFWVVFSLCIFSYILFCLSVSVK